MPVPEPNDLIKVLNYNFDSPNNFDIAIINNFNNSSETDIELNLDFEEINANLVSIETPPSADASIETYLNDDFVITRGREDIKEITITFRDYKSLTLYKKFKDFFVASKNLYPNECSFTIVIFHKTKFNDGITTNVSYENCLMTNMTGVSLNHSSINELLTFSIGFKTTSKNIKIEK